MTAPTCLLWLQFLRLGYGGFQKIMKNLDMAKKRLTLALQRTGGVQHLGT